MTVDTMTSHQALLSSAKAHNDKFAAQGKTETRDAYLRRLVSATSELSDDDFKALPEGAQDWFNRCATAFNEQENPTIPDLDGFDGEQPSGEAGTGPEVVDKPARGRGRRARGDKSADADGQTPPAGATASRSTTGVAKQKGVVRLVREFMITNPKSTNEELMEQCKANGLADVKLSSVSLTRVDALAFFRVLRDMGKLPEGMELPPDRGAAKA